jgi:hypothetical protein
MDKRGTQGAGALAAFSILAGAAVGVAMHQPSIGVLAGIAIGVIILAIFWLKDRR